MTEGPASKEEIEITPAMIQAGREALWDFSIDYQGEEVVQVVYREMAILDESRAPRFPEKSRRPLWLIRCIPLARISNLLKT